jgi:hypothetical protein
MKRYHIVFTTSTIAADLDEAIRIAVDQVRDGYTHTEIEEVEIEEEADSTDQQSLEDRKLRMTLLVNLMAVETADDPEAIYKEMIQAAADAGKEPEWIIDYFLGAGRGR